MNVRVTVLVFIVFSSLCFETKDAITTPLLPLLAPRIGQECGLRPSKAHRTVCRRCGMGPTNSARAGARSHRAVGTGVGGPFLAPRSERFSTAGRECGPNGVRRPICFVSGDREI